MATTYVFAVEDGVTKHYDRVHAIAYAGTLDPPGLVVSEPGDLPAAGTENLRDLYWLIVPGSLVDDPSQAVVFKAIADKSPITFTEPTAVKDLPPVPAVAPRGTKKMSEAQTATPAAEAPAAKAKAPTKKTTKANGAKKAAAPKAKKAAAPRGKGKPAGKPADFKPVMKGSKRGNILELMTGKLNAEGIGAKLGIPPSLVSSNIFCLHRDCAIGYGYGPNGEITALFPTGKTLADALKVANAKPAPKAKAAAKKAPKKGAAKK